jgi:uncharacterized protein YciI
VTTILPPLRRQIIVPADAGTAFAVFTDQIGAWWPMAGLSVYGARSTATFRDGVLVETGPGGEESVWGEVLVREPPGLLRMTWHPGYGVERASVVEVTFVPVTDTQTLVTVTHTGWERFAEPVPAREEYRRGWPGVLRDFSALVPAAEPGAGPVWLVLDHTPAPGVADPFAHPGFAGHPAWLEGVRDLGLLVGAGPFPGSGEGMTIVQLDDPGTAAALLRSANEDDTSVSGGVLEVRARPWVLLLH